MNIKTIISLILAVFFIYAGSASASTESSDNNYFGTGAGGASGDSNSFFGAYAGDVNDGSYNTFIGYSAGRDNTSSHFNTFIGFQAGQDNTTGHNNTFNGSRITNHDPYFLSVLTHAMSHVTQWRSSIVFKNRALRFKCFFCEPYSRIRP